MCSATCTTEGSDPAAIPPLPRSVHDLCGWRRGYALGWTLPATVSDLRLAAEFYSHLGMVRRFGLTECIAYKRGPAKGGSASSVAVSCLLKKYVPDVELFETARKLCNRVWSKDFEQQTDALICALIGYWPWHYRDARTRVLGRLESGCFLIPRP